jgi:hypothetical protein
VRIAFLNGPPRAGKDTLARRATSHDEPGVYDLSHQKIAFPLKAFAQRAHNLPFLDEAWLDHHKDAPMAELEGRSPRQILISLAQNYFKPTFGKDYFGRKAVEMLKATANSVVGVCYSDSGFDEELRPVIAWAGIENTLIVRLHRPGYDFAGDSRRWLEVPGVRSYDVQNYTIEYLNELACWVKHWLRTGERRDPPTTVPR